MIRLLILSLCFSFGVVCFASEEQVCIRNYNMNGLNPCETMKDMFEYVVPANDSTTVALCTRVRTGMCEAQGRPFVRIVAESGKEICVIDYNQKSTGNYCEAEELKSYHYAKKNGETFF